MKYLIFLLAFSFFLSCKDAVIPEIDNIGIRVINDSEIDFDTLRISIFSSEQQYEDLLFLDIEEGETTFYLPIEELSYYHYGDNTYIYFSNYFIGSTEEDRLFASGYGFCGTGLITETVTEGNFTARITGIDEDNNWMFIEQIREE